MGERIYITDKDLCNILLITPATLCRILSGFFRGGEKSSRTTLCAKVLRLGEAKPEVVGGYRRWKVSEVAKVLEISKEEILNAIA